MITTTTAADQQLHLVKKRIELVDPIVTDRRRAEVLREQNLDNLKISDDVVYVIDLNQIQVLSLSAADEFIVKWLERSRTRRNTLIAVFATFDREIKETLNTALREGRQAAYYVRSDPTHETADVLGDVNAVQRSTVETIKNLQYRNEPTEPITAKHLAKQMGLQPTTANMRLTDLYERGLIVRDRIHSNGSTAYRYPLPAVPTQKSSPIRSR